VGELLKRVTDKLGLQIEDHFLCFDSTSPNNFIPNRNDKLTSLVCDILHDNVRIHFYL